MLQHTPYPWSEDPWAIVHTVDYYTCSPIGDHARSLAHDYSRSPAHDQRAQQPSLAYTGTSPFVIWLTVAGIALVIAGEVGRRPLAFAAGTHCSWASSRIRTSEVVVADIRGVTGRDYRRVCEL